MAEEGGFMAKVPMESSGSYVARQIEYKQDKQVYKYKIKLAEQ
jgi:hypothetical protein